MPREISIRFSFRRRSRHCLLARLERLPPDELSVAEVGAVVGRTFEQAAVAEIRASGRSRPPIPQPDGPRPQGVTAIRKGRPHFPVTRINSATS